MSGSSPSSAQATPRRSGASVISRETLAPAAIAAPAATALAAGLAPRRAVEGVALAGALASAVAAGAVSAVALVSPLQPHLGPWLGVDAAGGSLVGACR